MACGQVTLGAGQNTRLQINTQRAMQLIIQNNTGASIRVGDDTRVSSTFGLVVGAGGSDAAGTFTSGATNLNAWYIAGASGAVIDFQFTPED
jgi:hypothetical protein